MHRIGRTGRAQAEGDAFTLMTAEEGPDVSAIERFIGQEIERKKLDNFKYVYSLALDEKHKHTVGKAGNIRGGAPAKATASATAAANPQNLKNVAALSYDRRSNCGARRRGSPRPPGAGLVDFRELELRLRPSPRPAPGGRGLPLHPRSQVALENALVPAASLPPPAKFRNAPVILGKAKDQLPSCSGGP